MFKGPAAYSLIAVSMLFGCATLDEGANTDLVEIEIRAAEMSGGVDEFLNYYRLVVSNGTDFAICYNALAYPRGGVYYYHDFELYDQNLSEFRSIGHSSIWRNEQMAFNVIYPGQTQDFLFNLNVVFERSDVEAGSHDYRFTFGYIHCSDVANWRGGDSPVLLYQDFGRTSVLEGTILVRRRE